MLRLTLDIGADADDGTIRVRAEDCPLFDLPNAIVTPHIAESLDGECERMGQWMAAEVQRYVAGKPLLGLISPEQVPAPAILNQATPTALPSRHPHFPEQND